MAATVTLNGRTFLYVKTKCKQSSKKEFDVIPSIVTHRQVSGLVRMLLDMNICIEYIDRYIYE